MTSENKEKLLERYVNGEALSADEEKLIEQLLETDVEFRAEFRARMALFEAGKQNRRAAWAELQKKPTPKTVVFQPTMARWAAAASIVFMIGFGLWWWDSQTNTDANREIAVYERYDNQQGIATSGQKPVDHIILTLSEAKELGYQFSNYDTLRVFTPDLAHWKSNKWKVIRLSEAEYELVNETSTQQYLIEQGRKTILPLNPKKD